MSLKSKCDQYDYLIKELFELLDRTEVQILCHHELDRLKLEGLLELLKLTMEDTG